MAHGLLYGASFTNGALSFTDKQGRTICNADLWNFLTLTATEDNSSVKLIKNGTLSNEFEVNVGNGWEAYTFDTVIPLNAGESCKWRCSAHPTMQSVLNYVKFVMTGTIEASGNCNSMLSSYFENLTSLSENDYAFYELFSDCTSLIHAPVLPAKTLAPYCYGSMFNKCTSLIQAPALPATLLSKSCYSNMFRNCTSLIQAPALPATLLSQACYIYMFQNCTSLIQAPALPAKTLAQACYGSMFQNCTSLIQAPALPAKTLARECYFNMFGKCSVLTEVRISATTNTVDDALHNWLADVSTTGNFYCDPSAEIFPTGASGIPDGWTRLPLSEYPTT